MVIPELPINLLYNASELSSIRKKQCVIENLTDLRGMYLVRN